MTFVSIYPWQMRNIGEVVLPLLILPQQIEVFVEEFDCGLDLSSVQVA